MSIPLVLPGASTLVLVAAALLSPVLVVAGSTVFLFVAGVSFFLGELFAFPVAHWMGSTAILAVWSFDHSQSLDLWFSPHFMQFALVVSKLLVPKALVDRVLRSFCLCFYLAEPHCLQLVGLPILHGLLYLGYYHRHGDLPRRVFFRFYRHLVGLIFSSNSCRISSSLIYSGTTLIILAVFLG